MESNADEREAERALLARYHADQPQPPAAVDAAIRSAARQALEIPTCAPGAAGAPPEGASRTSRGWALAAAAAMVALVLPGLLREPRPALEQGVDAMLSEVADGEVEALVASKSPVPETTLPVRREAAPTVPRVEPPAAQVSVAAEPADRPELLARRMVDDAPARAQRDVGAPLESDLQQLADVLGIEVPPRGGGLTARDGDAVAELVPQQRLQARFRPHAAQPEAVSVTLLDTMVVIVGEWSGEGEPCEPLLALDRAPEEPAQVSVEHIAGRTAEDFVFLRLESPSRVRLVHCTAEGWMVSAR